MTTKKKAPPRKTTEPEDFNQGAFRIVQNVAREKPKTHIKRLSKS